MDRVKEINVFPYRMKSEVLKISSADPNEDTGGLEAMLLYTLPGERLIETDHEKPAMGTLASVRLEENSDAH